MSLVQIDIC